MGAEFVRGRVCQGSSLLGAEMSRNQNVNRFRALDTDHDLRLVGSDLGVGPDRGANCLHCKGCLNTLSDLIMHG